MADLFRLLFLSLILVTTGCLSGHSSPPDSTIQSPEFLLGDTALAMRTLDGMSMSQRLAQLMMVPLYSRPGETTSFREVSAWIEEHGVGGIIAMQGDKATTRANIGYLDSLAMASSGLPLLTAMDAEWGSAMRLPDGLGFPKAMALGAIEDLDLIRTSATHAGQELVDLGIYMDFAPVVDVNSNPANPVIGNRSFGSNPTRVGELGLAWAQGLRASGVLAVAKHFPGHGDADLDSHLALPLIQSDSVTLANVELPPFRALIQGGVEGVMTAHLSVPAIDSSTGLPTSLSPLAIQSLLLDGLKFKGLVITDALGMAGVAEPVPAGKREILALQAGNDILLFPSRPQLALDSLHAALSDGRLDSSRINGACLKVILAKQWSRQHSAPKDDSLPPLPELQKQLRGAMLTQLGPASPLVLNQSTALVIIGNRGDALERRLKLSIPHLQVVRHGKGTITATEQARMLAECLGAQQVLVAFLDESNRPARRFGLPSGAEALAKSLGDTHDLLRIALFTSPYALQYFEPRPNTSWLMAYHEDALTQISAAEAWCGEGHALGTLPVDVGPWHSGQGTPTSASRLPRAQSAPHLRLIARLDSLANAALHMEATPGLRIMVVAQDSIRYDGCHGHLGDAQETPVQRHHVYDLASITKVASTTLLTMMSEERGMLSLDQPLAELVPKSENVPLQVELGRRTIKDLLAHRSGLPAWIPFYLDLIAYHDTTGLGLADPENPMADWVSLCDERCMAPGWADSISTRIRSTEPKPPGRYRYSDLGYYLLQDILEDLWGKPIDQLADSMIYAPLGLTRMGYTPLDWSELTDIAPTELDTLFRKTHVRGTVHDPGAAMMNGIAGHAGLFSDAHDLALLMEVMRQGGTRHGVTLVQTGTAALFNQRAFPNEDNRRGIGWDKPGLHPDTGASGDAGSWSSFGHSGFTGTLAWSDPDGDWTVVFLSNRICPDPENRTLIDEDIRTKALCIVQEELGLPFRFEAERGNEDKPGSPH